MVIDSRFHGNDIFRGSHKNEPWKKVVMHVTKTIRKLLFALIFAGLTVCPMPHFSAEEYHELINYNDYKVKNLTQRVSKKKFLVHSEKTVLIKNFSSPEITSTLPGIFLVNLFPTAPRTALSSTRLLL
jgi:uncharacterized protein involved in cysteine biosynthesis